MKTIYYSTRWDGGGIWSITFWTKPDRSNAITERFVTLEESKLRKRIESVLGIKNFRLELVKQ